MRLLIYWPSLTKELLNHERLRRPQESHRSRPTDAVFVYCGVDGQVGISIGSRHHYTDRHFQPSNKFDGGLVVPALLIVGVCNLT